MQRLARFSGAKIEMSRENDKIVISGNSRALRMARLVIGITDAQRSNGGRDVDFKGLEQRWVPAAPQQWGSGRG